MGRRRATRRTSIQRVQRIARSKEKGLEEFRDALMSRGEVDEVLGLYHEKYIVPVFEEISLKMSPWWKRLWWWAQDRWDERRGK